MAKYLFIGNYTGDGIRGVIKDGGSKRRAAAQALFDSIVRYQQSLKKMRTSG